MDIQIGYIIGTLGSIASIIGVIIYFFQRKHIRSLEKQNERNIWKQIAASKALMRHLEREDIHQAYGLACEQFRDLIKEASLIERNFDIRTIKLWRKVGKLSSDWQERQSLMLLSTKDISKGVMINEGELNIENEVAKYDDTPEGHPVAKLRPTKSQMKNTKDKPSTE